MRIYLFIIALIFLSSCKSINRQEVTQLDEEKESKILIDSLINVSSSGSDDRIIMGSVNNLDIINGFRKLKFNLNFDSIEFRDWEIDPKYKSKGIIIVSKLVEGLLLFDQKDSIELIFLNNELNQIWIWNTKKTNVRGSQNKFSIQYKDLFEIYGNPTKILLEKQYDRVQDINNSIDTISEVDYQWNTDKVTLIFYNKKGWQALTQNIPPFKLYPLKLEASVYWIYQNKNHKLITEALQFIKDSIGFVNKEKSERDLLNKF